MMFDLETKKKIHKEYTVDSMTKSSLAKKYGCSPRTIGRVLASINGLNSTGDVSTPAKKQFLYYVCTDKNMISIIRVDPTGQEPPTTEVAYVGDPRYDNAKQHYLNGNNEDAYEALSFKIRLENLCMGKVTVYPEKGVLEYTDGPNKMQLPTDLADRIVRALKDGEEETIEGLMNFANRLVENPSRRSVAELYTFLQATDIKIDHDGMILCYKKVREDYTDVHTGKFDNSVGAEPSMPRSMVDDDSSVTCSRGLHVCSKAYLPHFPGKRVVLCSVDPKDVVSVPEDYYSLDDVGMVRAKMRVSRYRVVEDVTGKV